MSFTPWSDPRSDRATRAPSRLVLHRRRPRRWSRARSVLSGGLILVVATIAVGAGSVAGAQESEQSESIEVSVTGEPGVCTELGAFCERLMDWTGNERFSETTAWLLGTPLKIAVIILAAALANRLARGLIRKGVAGLESEMTSSIVSDTASLRSDERAETIGALLRSAASAVIFSISAILVLENLGVSIMPLLASLGIAGLAVGFGAQTLIEDLISGVMLVIEDQLGVGDSVDVGVVEGTVERLTLRSTVILDSSGVRWYVPNSEIRRVANQSQHKAQAKAQVEVAYSTDLAGAVSVLHDAASELCRQPHWQAAGTEDVGTPFVAELRESGVVLEIHVPVDPAKRVDLEKALRQEVAFSLASSEIELPRERFDVWLESGVPTRP